MTESPSDRRTQCRAAIDRFLQERCDAKLDKLSADDPLRADVAAQFQRDIWLADAARRVSQIQAVTHTLKAIHPDARGTNLFCQPDALRDRTELDSHALGTEFASDVVGNAAALDVYRFLRIVVDGRTLLDAMQRDDRDLAAALSDDAVAAQTWIKAFVGLIEPRGTPATHTKAKQVFWLVGDDAFNDADFHLLAPLYSSSLAHAVFLRINDDRYGEAAQAARSARREGRDHPEGYAEYPGLAVQKLGGTKPQNISQLNSERRGVNYLLASLPPTWTVRVQREPWHIDTVFPRYGRRDAVRELARRLRTFLESDPDPKMDTRDTVESLVDQLVDELVIFAGDLHFNLASGWSADTRCELADEERLWLDPQRAEHDDDFRCRWLWMDWPAVIGRRFGNWLNSQLGDKLPFGAIEQRHWTKELLVDAEWLKKVDEQRRKVDRFEPVAAGEAT